MNSVNWKRGKRLPWLLDEAQASAESLAREPLRCREWGLPSPLLPPTEEDLESVALGEEAQASAADELLLGAGLLLPEEAQSSAADETHASAVSLAWDPRARELDRPSPLLEPEI